MPRLKREGAREIETDLYERHVSVANVEICIRNFMKRFNRRGQLLCSVEYPTL